MAASQGGGRHAETWCAGAHQASAYFPDVSLAKASHMFKPKVDVGGDCTRVLDTRWRDSLRLFV